MGKSISATMFIGLIFIVASSPAYSQEIEYKDYKVLKGDTLWDISSKEIQDPFLWPKIWKENPEIKNPDRINPDQTIKIPLGFLQKEQPQLEEAASEKASAAIPEPAKIEQEPTRVAERKIEPIQKNYLIAKELLISSGYITDYIAPEVKSIGKISGSSSGKSLFGAEDYVYIKTHTPATTGEKFYIIRSAKYIKHPKTKNKIGHLIEVLGIAEVIGIENSATKAKITQTFSEVRTGDLLDTYYEIEPPMEEESPRSPDISGVIVATQQMKIINGYLDILFIDKGSNNGIEVGDMLKTISIDKHNQSRTTGVIQIINLKGSTASAVVRQSESAIGVGDEVVSLK